MQLQVRKRDTSILSGGREQAKRGVGVPPLGGLLIEPPEGGTPTTLLNRRDDFEQFNGRQTVAVDQRGAAVTSFWIF